MDPEREEPESWILQEGDPQAGTEASGCGHGNRQHLGGDAGGNVYFRCQECGAVLIQEGSVSWKEHREEQQEALQEREQGDNPLRGLLESEEGGIFDRGGPDRIRSERPEGSLTVRVRRVIQRIRGR